MDAAIRRAGGPGAPPARRLEALRQFFLGQFRGVPGETLAGLSASFAEIWARDEERALAWLGGVSSLLLQDYDGTDFSAAEWADIKASVEVSAGEMDLDLLSYLMGMVLEHGAL